jgi:AraC-like DNA-binding protein
VLSLAESAEALSAAADELSTAASVHTRDELGLAKIANVIGYGSPYAFAAAFRRHHGDPPGAWRQRELTRTSSPVAGDRIHLR